MPLTETEAHDERIVMEQKEKHELRLQLQIFARVYEIFISKANNNITGASQQNGKK